MNLVILNAGPDTAGCAIGLKRAFDRHARGWSTRAICRRVTYLDYESDILWPRDAPESLTRQVVDLVRTADVVHVMDAESALRPFRRVFGRQAIVVQHLGTHFRRDPEGVSAVCRSYGAVEVTDSVDLLLSPRISWLPVTTDTDGLAALRTEWLSEARKRPPRPRIRIAHAPTDRAIKSTETIIAVVDALAERYPIDFDLIEGVSNRECLERKAQADIFVDQLDLGFGVNAIECWAMGIPVVSGLSDPNARQRAFQLWGYLPWADATVETLAGTIETLVSSASERARVGEVGRAHAERWHSQRAVVDQTFAVYERAGLRVAA